MNTNTTYRVLVEKLGSSSPSQFVGNEGEVFYDPNNPILKLSDGSSPGGITISSGGGGGGGAQGTQGIQGRQGIQGTTGAQGIQGIQGLTGTGIQGTQGIQGSEGLQGTQGIQGESIQGIQGIQGIEGLQGTQGIQGVQGPAGGGGGSTGDVTFDSNKVIGFGTGSGDGNGYSTLELVPDNTLYGGNQYIIVDPTGPNHIHLRAGGTQDNSNSELYLGGEKNNVRIIDNTGVRLYNEETTDNFYYYNVGNQFNSATWTSGGGQNYIEIQTTDAQLINNIFNVFSNNSDTLQITTVEQGAFTVTNGGGATSMGGDIYRLYTQETPSPDPQTVTDLVFTLYTIIQNRLELQNNDLTVVVTDDVRITGGDVVSLRNTSPGEPITIITNYDSANDNIWAFNDNGTLTFPDNNIQTTGITDTKISEWDDAYGWGNHANAGYLTSFSETDPAFVASVAAGIGSTNIDNWNTAYGWGDHSTAGYISSTSTSYAQTLIVDPDGDDVAGNGGPNAPFKTVQAAHDYADVNIPVANQVVVKLNTGVYSGDLLVTRPNIHFVGPTQGVSKSTRISGIVTVSTGSSVGAAANDMVSFENILIVSNSGTSAVTIGGTFGCSVMFKDAYVFTSSSTAKCVDVTNTAASGVGIHMKNTQLQNQSSSGTTLNLSNTYYANLDLVTLFSGTGISVNITTTDAVVYNTRIEKTGIGTAIVANSSFTAGKPSLILGNATIVNPTANSDGILVPSGSTVNIAQVAFNIAGTGFAVKGSAGSVVVHGNNLFVPGTTNKISSGIGAGNIPLTTAFTAA